MIKLFKLNDKGLLKEVNRENHIDQPFKHVMIGGIDILLTEQEILDYNNQQTQSQVDEAARKLELENKEKLIKSLTDKLCALGLTIEEIKVLNG